MKYKCLSIAGFDGSGGAGIQADLKTFAALGCYGMTVLTALPVQNTCGVRSCHNIPLNIIEEQLEAIFDDIIPDAIKIGMLFSEEIIELVSVFLAKYAVNIPIVLDPVMVAKSGDRLLMPNAICALKTKLVRLAKVITPNIYEAQSLVGEVQEFEVLGKKLLELGSEAVLLKGGHSKDNDSSDDLFLDRAGQCEWIRSARIKSKNTHGTGCTLSAAICAFIAQGHSLFGACERAKRYLFGAMFSSQYMSIGRGHGPVHHFHNLWPATLHVAD